MNEYEIRIGVDRFNQGRVVRPLLEGVSKDHT